MVTSNPTVFTPISDRRLASRIAVIPSAISTLAGQPVFQERPLISISAWTPGIKHLLRLRPEAPGGNAGHSDGHWAAQEVQKLGTYLSNRACKSDQRLPKASAFSWLCSRLPEARLETRFEEAIVWKMTPVNTRGRMNFERSHLAGGTSGTISGGTKEVTVMFESPQPPYTVWEWSANQRHTMMVRESNYTESMKVLFAFKSRGVATYMWRLAWSKGLGPEPVPCRASAWSC